MDKESRDNLIQTRWSWQQLLLVAVGLFALLFGVDFVSKGLLFPGHGTTVIYIRAVIRFTYALIAAGIVYYGLGGTKLLKRPTPLTAFLKIMITIIGVLLVLLLVLSNFPYRLVAMVHSKFFIADTLVALSAGIFEEFTCRGLLLSAFADAFRLSRHRYTWAAVTSGACFGLLHLFNILAGQGITATVQQAIYAFVLGILFVTVRLTTNSLIWVIVIHFFIDWQPMISSQVMTGSSSPWPAFLIVWTLLLLIGLAYVIGFDRNIWRHSGLTFL